MTPGRTCATTNQARKAAASVAGSVSGSSAASTAARGSRNSASSAGGASAPATTPAASTTGFGGRRAAPHRWPTAHNTSAVRPATVSAGGSRSTASPAANPASVPAGAPARTATSTTAASTRSGTAPPGSGSRSTTPTWSSGTVSATITGLVRTTASVRDDADDVDRGESGRGAHWAGRVLAGRRQPLRQARPERRRCEASPHGDLRRRRCRRRRGR